MRRDGMGPGFLTALKKFLLALAVLVVALLLMGTVMAQSPETSVTCDAAAENFRNVKSAVEERITLAEKMPKRGSAMRLAVLQAKEGRGFYGALRLMLPLACTGDRLALLDSELIDEMTKLDIFVDKNW